jgi:hypothetical protein
MIVTIFFLISTHLAAGMLATLLLVSPKYLGEKFYRFVATIALVLLILSQIAHRIGGAPDWRGQIDRAVPWLWAAAALALFYIVTLPLRNRPVNRLLLGAAVGCAGVSLALMSGGMASHAIAGFVFPLDFFLSALALGSVTTCMILGHWYLVQPGMSMKPLQLTAGVFIAAVAARVLLSSYTSIVVWNELASTGMDPFSNAILTSLLFFGQRVLFGLALPLALSWMIWQTVKIRSTQSATGILYVAVVFILFGEFISRCILVSTGYPL